MKKAERLNQELFFINRKKNFTLKELMSEFQISKSTALRDIESLEQLGAPLYAEKGRFGGYRLLNSSLLPPVYFSDNELKSVFFSLQLLESFMNTPFQKNYEEIYKKLLSTLPDEKKEKILAMKNSVLFVGSEQYQDAPYLPELFSYTLNQEVIKIQYSRYGKIKNKWIQPINLQAMDGNWYCSALDFEKEEYRVYRCDFITAVETSSRYKRRELDSDTVRAQFTQQRQLHSTRKFKVQVSNRGVEKFKKRHFSNMELINESDQHYIIGNYSENEQAFLVEYFLSFGSEVLILDPEELVIDYKEYLRELNSRYLTE